MAGPGEPETSEHDPPDMGTHFLCQACYVCDYNCLNHMPKSLLGP